MSIRPVIEATLDKLADVASNFQMPPEEFIDVLLANAAAIAVAHDVNPTRVVGRLQHALNAMGAVIHQAPKGDS